MKKISVLIPCYNEVENARAICEAVRDELRKLSAYDYEILFIDNKSTDGTREVLEQLCHEDPKVKAIFNAKNFGQFNSPYYGLLQTEGDCTIMICADFQDPVELIPQFIAKWEQGYPVVVGCKTRSRENPILYFLRGCYYKMIRKMSSVGMIEQFTGFGLYDKTFIQTMRQLHDPIPFLRGVVAELAPDYARIEYEQPKRRAGKSHNNWYSLFDAAMLSFTSYTKVGMRVAEFFGFGVAAISFLIGLFYLVAKLLFWDSFVTGYAPTMIALFFMGGVQLTFLGFLGEYIMTINTRIMNRPLVVEEKRFNFDGDPAGATENEETAQTLSQEGKTGM